MSYAKFMPPEYGEHSYLVMAPQGECRVWKDRGGYFCRLLGTDVLVGPAPTVEAVAVLLAVKTNYPLA